MSVPMSMVPGWFGAPNERKTDITQMTTIFKIEASTPDEKMKSMVMTMRKKQFASRLICDRSGRTREILLLSIP